MKGDLIRKASRWLPPSARRYAASAWCEWRSHTVASELSRLARSSRPIVLGPWLGEVGFELLYWIPFLDWAIERFAFDRGRLVVISRGGTGRWYRNLSARYRDVFEFIGEDEFRVRNRARIDAIGEQKQVRPTAFELDLVAAVARAEGLQSPQLLHPALMYRAFSPYWWGHRGEEWVHRHARFQRLPAPTPGERPAGLPDPYVAVKFYYNDAFPETTENRACAARVVRQLAKEGPVVSLATGLRIDDHHGWQEEEHHALRGIRAGMNAATNLAMQNAIVAGARAWVGTYGGFAYLAPFHGVPGTAFYSRPDGFSRRHLDLALSVFDGFAPGLLSLTDVREARGVAAAR